MRYYIADESQENGFIEVTEAEYKSFFGDDVTSPYVQGVYRGDIVIDDVPVEYREAVKTIVANKVNRWGRYEEAIDPAELNRQYTETDEPITTEE